ncbi:MAG TPA: hypothetical protein VFA70_05710, partial [Dehalococcoidia bacterium]|nr:hypothetical protein [Dehalococcoidia bacterium]
MSTGLAADGMYAARESLRGRLKRGHHPSSAARLTLIPGAPRLVAANVHIGAALAHPPTQSTISVTAAAAMRTVAVQPAMLIERRFVRSPITVRLLLM